jgi:hypothetical protein
LSNYDAILTRALRPVPLHGHRSGCAPLEPLVHVARTEVGMPGQDSSGSRPTDLLIGKITPICTRLQRRKSTLFDKLT